MVPAQHVYHLSNVPDTMLEPTCNRTHLHKHLPNPTRNCTSMAPIAVFDHMATSARAVELKQAAAGKAMTSGEIKFSPYNQYSEYLKKHPEFPAKYPQ